MFRANAYGQPSYYSNMMPPTFQQEPLNHYNHVPYQPNQRGSIIIIHHSNHYESMYPAFKPTLNFSQPPMGTFPAYFFYNSYAKPSFNQMQAPFVAPFFGPYNFGNSMKFGVAQPPSTHFPLAQIDSVYCMDFMDDESPHASISVTTALVHTESTEKTVIDSELSSGTENYYFEEYDPTPTPSISFMQQKIVF
uniref:Uncharacterized protein n=1 Tax=Panagrolaimus superbus TaxID=310955 RepID=A0A914YJV7_9BILA